MAEVKITAQMIKELREMTGVGMKDCKAALVESNGDINRAVEILREKGLAAGEKKAGRIAAEGLVYAHVSEDKSVAAIVEVNSETDFVSKNKDFQDYVMDVVNQAMKTDSTEIDAFLKEKWNKDEALTVEEALSQKIAVIGENLKIRRFNKYVKSENRFLSSYIHAGGKVGVLIELETANITPEAEEAAKNVCLQIAAMSPKFVDREDVDQEYLESEKAILRQQTLNEGKPENIVDKIVEGRINKVLEGVTLNAQVYVKDTGDNFTIKKYLQSVEKDLKVIRFTRFETGEGIEKKEEDFAAEVEKAMGKED